MNPETKIQSKIIKRLKEEGWYVIRLTSTNLPGIPDLLALKKGETPFFIEVKVEDGKLTELQKYRMKELLEKGFRVETWRK